MDSPVIDASTVISVLAWLIGGLISIVIALVGILYSVQAKEVLGLKRWKEETVNPKLHLVDTMNVRLNVLEEIVDDKRNGNW